MIIILLLILLSLFYIYLLCDNGTENFEQEDNFVFIMVRHINSELTNKYWIESYKHIRKVYPNTKIIIIDDNSDKQFVKDNNIELDNVEFVESEFPKRGELLPYYYFYKNKYAKNAVIIHDSIFIKNKIDFNNMNDDVKFLWHHGHWWNDNFNEKRLIGTLKNSDNLLKLYDNKDSWKLCVGVMSFTNHDFLVKLQDNYNFFNLIDHVKSRNDRMCLERIFGLLCNAENKQLINDPSIFGIQHLSNYSYYDYERDMKQNRATPIFTKIWTGR
jgi:hypothetical protein